MRAPHTERRKVPTPAHIISYSNLRTAKNKGMNAPFHPSLSSHFTLKVESTCLDSTGSLVLLVRDGQSEDILLHRVEALECTASTGCQPAQPTQVVEGASFPAKPPTPPPSQSHEPIDVSGLAEQSLEECLPLYFGAKHPRQHVRNVWHDEADCRFFIRESMSP